MTRTAYALLLAGGAVLTITGFVAFEQMPNWLTRVWGLSVIAVAAIAVIAAWRGDVK